MSARNCLVIAHRGASTYAPENTYAAFDLALDLGARHLELDVQLSSDGHLVVIHDDKVNRTTNGDGAVSALSLQELQSLDAGAWFDAQYGWGIFQHLRYGTMSLGNLRTSQFIWL